MEQLADVVITGAELPPVEHEAPKGLIDFVYSLGKAGRMRQDAVDHLVRHVRRAHALRIANGEPSPEEQAARHRADVERNREIWNRQVLVNAFDDARIAPSLRDSNLYRDIHGKPLVIGDGNSEARRLCQMLIDRWAPGMKGIALGGGPSGCGKTYFALAVCVEIIRRTHTSGKVASCMVMTERDLMRLFRRAIDNSSDPSTPTAREVTEICIRRPDILVVDDLGAEKPTEWTVGQMLDICNKRESKTTIFTTNLTRKTLEGDGFYGPRVMSRLLSRSVWCDITGPDWRQADDTDDPFASDDQGLVEMFNRKAGR